MAVNNIPLNRTFTIKLDDDESEDDRFSMHWENLQGDRWFREHMEQNPNTNIIHVPRVTRRVFRCFFNFRRRKSFFDLNQDPAIAIDSIPVETLIECFLNFFSGPYDFKDFKNQARTLLGQKLLEMPLSQIAQEVKLVFQHRAEDPVDLRDFLINVLARKLRFSIEEDPGRQVSEISLLTFLSEVLLLAKSDNLSTLPEYLDDREEAIQ